MSDSVTVTRSSGYWSRLGNSLKNVIVGFILVFWAIGLLAWNEYRSVEREKTLNEGEKVVVEGVIDRVNPDLEGKLVHVMGVNNASGALKDEVFGIQTDQLKLERRVLMYQWEETQHTETEDKIGGGQTETTTYTYHRKRSEEAINSNNFYEKAGHQNPTDWKYQGETWVQDPIMLGKFTLAPVFVEQLATWEDVKIDTEQVILTGDENTHISRREIYIGKNPSQPEIGDLKIKFLLVPKGDISIIGKQTADTLTSYRTSNRGEVSLLEQGKIDAPEMFARAYEMNAYATWGFRLVGLLFLFFGFKMIFWILVAIAKVLPFLGSVLDFGTGIVALILTIAVGLGTIAISWLFVRPIRGISLLVIIVGLIWWIKHRQQKKKDTAPQDTSTVKE